MYYVRDDEDVAQSATTVVASAAAPGYPAEHLVHPNPAQPAKLTTTTGSWVLQFLAKKAPVGAALIYQYLDEGLSGVTIQGNDTDSWGSPAFEAEFEIPPKRRDGPSYQRWTRNALVLFDELPDPAGYLYWRLVIEGTNSQPITIGRLWLLQDLHHVDLMHANGDIPEGDETPSKIVDFTELQVRLVTVIGGPQRSFVGTLIATDLDAGTAPIVEASEFRALAESTNGTEALVLVIPQFVDNEPWCGYFESEPSKLHAQGGYQIWTIPFREASRGVPWP